MNGEYYLQIFHHLCSRIVSVGPEQRKGENPVLLHDNAIPYKTKYVWGLLIKKQICFIDHPPHSPSLISCHSSLFNSSQSSGRETDVKEISFRLHESVFS